ncbi:hypothetical protein Tco_0857351, partial [Tanacetum coccineum]
FNTTAGNPVKKILLKLNLSDHRILKDGGGVKEVQRSFRHSDTERLSRSDEVLKLKNFKKDATLKLSKSTNQERLFAAGRKYMAHISVGQFVARLAEHFGLLTAEILGGLTVIAPELPIINMAELVRLLICVEINYTWTWVAMGPERQPNAAVGAPAIPEDAPAIDEGDQDVLALVHVPQQPPPPPPAAAARTQLKDASGLTYQTFDETFRGSSPLAIQRRTRQRTDIASTFAAQQDPPQPDP